MCVEVLGLMIRMRTGVVSVVVVVAEAAMAIVSMGLGRVKRGRLLRLRTLEEREMGLIP